MILSLFALLVGVCLVLIVIGLARPSESYCALVGFFLLFILSLTILNGTLEYKIGENITYQYGHNFTGEHWKYEDPSSPQHSFEDSAFLFHTWEYDNYAYYQSKTLGLWLAIVSAIGFAGVLFSLKKDKEQFYGTG